MAEPFRMRSRVRYHEVDAQGHVFNARYLEFLDVAMTEWLRELTGMPYTVLVARGCDVVLARTTLEFRAPARFDDELETTVRVASVGTSSFVLDFTVSAALDARELVKAQTVYVNFDAAAAGKRPLPGFLRALLEG
ncbi:MAG: thioesterase family protein [Solirubrobacteraceae bacterium]